MGNEMEGGKVGFTPGPWRVVMGTRGYPVAINAPNDDGRAGAVGNVVRHNGIGLPSSPRALANSHLIAAAPDLHRELREARSMMEHVGFGDDGDDIKRIWRKHLRRIDAALAKAEGRTP